MIELTLKELESIRKVPNWHKNRVDLIRDADHLALVLSSCLYGLKDEAFKLQLISDIGSLFEKRGYNNDYFTKQYLKFCRETQELRLSI
jgi:hypothetical protein